MSYIEIWLIYRLNITRMPTIVRIGCKVIAKTGPLVHLTPGGKRRSRTIFHGTILSSGRLSSAELRTWKVIWSECGKCCDHPSKSLRIVSGADTTFDPSLYSNLRDVDYYATLTEFLQFVNKDNLTPGLQSTMHKDLKIQTRLMFSKYHRIYWWYNL